MRALDLTPRHTEDGCRSFLQPPILGITCWYLNERSVHKEFEYVITIIILIQGSLDIVCTGKERVKTTNYVV